MIPRMKYNRIPRFSLYQKTFRSLSSLNQRWNEFLQITTKAAELVPLEQLDLKRYHLLSTFESISNGIEITEKLKELTNHNQSSYIMYTMIRLFITLGNIPAAFVVFKFMTERLNGKKSNGNQNIPRYHLYVTNLLGSFPQLSHHTEFQLLRFKSIAMAQVPAQELYTTFQQVISDTKDPKTMKRLYNVTIACFATFYQASRLILRLINEKRICHQLETTRRDRKWLMHSFLHEGEPNMALEVYSDMKARGIEIGPEHLNLAVKSLLYVGDVQGAIKLLQQSSLAPNLYIWTSLMHGIAKRPRNSMSKVLKLFEQIKELGFIPDAAVYNSIIYGYFKRGDVGNGLVWYHDMQAAHIAPDAATFGILQNARLSLARKQTQNNTIPYKEQISNILATLSHLSTPISQSNEILQNIRENKYKSVEEMIQVLEKNPYLNQVPELYDSIFETLARSNHPQRMDFLQHMRLRNIRATNRTYSILVYLCSTKGSDANRAWDYLQEMKKNGLYYNESLYQSLIKVAIKTNDVKRLRELIARLTAPRNIPFSRRLYLQIVSMLSKANHGLFFDQAIETRHIYPKEWAQLEQGQDQLKQKLTKTNPLHLQYCKLAMDVFRTMIQFNKFPNKSHFGLFLEMIHILKNPSTFLFQIKEWIDAIHPTLYHRRELMNEFDKVLFESLNWNYTRGLIHGLHDPQSSQYRICSEYLYRLGMANDAISIYTTFQYLSKNLHPNLIAIVIEQLGITIRNEPVTRRIWELIPLEIMNETILWTYIKCLFLWGHEQEGLEVATKGLEPKPEYSGMVVRELFHWFTLRGQAVQNQTLVAYWKDRKPEWLSPLDL